MAPEKEARDYESEGEIPDFPEESILELNGVIDLHTFSPKDVPSLLDEWIRASSRAGIAHVRIIHGKGTGALRSRVESILRRHPLVRRFRTAGEDGGGWGATLAEIDTGAAGS